MVTSPLRRRAALVVALLVVGVSPVVTTPTPASATIDASRRSLAELRTAAGSSLVIGRHDDAVTFLGGPRALTAPHPRDPTDVAQDFADRHGDHELSALARGDDHGVVNIIVRGGGGEAEAIGEAAA